MDRPEAGLTERTQSATSAIAPSEANGGPSGDRAKRTQHRGEGGRPNGATDQLGSGTTPASRPNELPGIPEVVQITQN